MVNVVGESIGDRSIQGVPEIVDKAVMDEGAIAVGEGLAVTEAQGIHLSGAADIGEDAARLYVATELR